MDSEARERCDPLASPGSMPNSSTHNPREERPGIRAGPRSEQTSRKGPTADPPLPPPSPEAAPPSSTWTQLQLRASKLPAAQLRGRLELPARDRQMRRLSKNSIWEWSFKFLCYDLCERGHAAQRESEALTLRSLTLNLRKLAVRTIPRGDPNSV